MKKKVSRNRISPEAWQQARLAHAAGAPLRKLAREMGIAECSMLTKAAREGWSQQAKAARQLAPMSLPPVSAIEAVERSMREDCDTFKIKSARAIAKAVSHAADLPAEELLERSGHISDLVGAGCKLHGIGGKDAPTVSVQVLNQRIVW